MRLSERKRKIAFEKARNITFVDFKKVIDIIVHFADKMDESEINDCIQDWYVLFKESKEVSVVGYMRSHLEDVNRNSHDFWLDRRGLLLMEIKEKLAEDRNPMF